MKKSTSKKKLSLKHVRLNCVYDAKIILCKGNKKKSNAIQGPAPRSRKIGGKRVSAVVTRVPRKETEGKRPRTFHSSGND